MKKITKNIEPIPTIVVNLDAKISTDKEDKFEIGKVIASPSYKETLEKICLLNGIKPDNDTIFTSMALFKDGQNVNYCGMIIDDLLINNIVPDYFPVELLEGKKNGDVIPFQFYAFSRPLSEKMNIKRNDRVLISSNLSLHF